MQDIEIRPMEKSDLEELADISFRCHVASGSPSLPGTFDKKKFMASVTALFDMPTFIGHVAISKTIAVGGIWGVVVSGFFNDNLIAEVFGWVTENEGRGHGVELFHNFQCAAKNIGVAAIVFRIPANENGTMAKQTVCKLGFKMVEETYFKEV